MIYNIKQNHTGNTNNTLLGEQKSNNGKTYRIHSCKISNTDTTNVYVSIKLHDGTNTIDLFKTFYIRKGYTLELFDEAFDYPDKYDLVLALDNSAYQVSWITKSEILDIESKDFTSW
jgi:hypothetical protein